MGIDGSGIPRGERMQMGEAIRIELSQFNRHHRRGKRAITETALVGVAVTYPVPLSILFGLG